MLLFAPIVGGATQSQQAIACGGTQNDVEVEFTLAEARDFWKVFPAAGISPELERRADSAYVVVFAGHFDQSGMVAAPGAETILENVVCVITADGEQFLYHNISRERARIP